ncbi:LacI family DNA-binding transcriptional regulator [Paenibacillus mendelii]|uniref:LacI family DNA-binding transcriptional regulator n=1 Tax=Paenibacillus mendelii TaxID=206163 RepID=A0ABV6J9Z5_9BACL|nr:LacI family DNA-binding transcriptional regulator [Paenibacillus mendelii]MCQ6561022.1 LacI family transcriptional regulator [Paenibacillus mendelii]
MNEKVTSNDVAKKAGVSQATVSRVINNYSFVRESTREKVLQAIEEMGFTPDQVARSLNMRKTGTIGLIVGDISNPFFSETAKVIIGEARESGFDVIISDTDHSDQNLGKAIQTLIGKRVDGMLIGSVGRFDTNVQQLVDKRFPLVMYNTRLDRDDCNYVVINNVKGARVAMKHLLDLGHQKIAYISGNTKYSTLYDRLNGYHETIKKQGLPFRQDYVYDGELTVAGLQRFLQTPWQDEERPTAFFASNDQIALLLMEAALSLGIRVPEDISIIGFDNISYSAKPFIQLTTVSQQHRRMASLALEKLIQLMNTDDKTLKVSANLEPEIIVRNTSAALEQ